MYSYDRRTAARPRKKNIPAPLPPPPPKKRNTLGDILKDGFYSLLTPAVRDATQGMLKKIKGIKALPSPTDHFSDGVEPAGRDLGFAFTIHYPTKVQATSTLDIKLPTAEQARKLLRREVSEEDETTLESADPGEIERIIKDSAPEWIPAILSDMEGEIAPEYGSNLPEDLRLDIESAAEQRMSQSISAYSRDDPEVHLVEYPSVYIRWDLGKTKIAFGSPLLSGLDYQIPINLMWDMRPTGWAFDEDVHRNLWHRL